MKYVYYNLPEQPTFLKNYYHLLGFPVLLAGDKVFANLRIKEFEFRVKPYTFAMGFTKPFLPPRFWTK